MKYFLEESEELAKNAKIKYKYIHLGMSVKKVLSCRQYVVFYLKSFNNLKYSAIADIMGLTESTIREHYRRALKKLSKL